MSEDKYPRILSYQIETIMFTILQIFFTEQAVLIVGILGNIRSHDISRSTTHKQKYLMDYKYIISCKFISIL